MKNELLSEQELFKLLLDKKLSQKNIPYRFSTRRALCRKCPYRIKCITNVFKICKIRRKVGTELRKATNLFKMLGVGKPKPMEGMGKTVGSFCFDGGE